jgi:hypothetical protein
MAEFQVQVLLHTCVSNAGTAKNVQKMTQVENQESGSSRD